MISRTIFLLTHCLIVSLSHSFIYSLSEGRLLGTIFQPNNAAYFITACTRDRCDLFNEIVDGEMRLNEIGSVVLSCWNELPTHYPEIELDACVVMPNHVHGIIMKMDDEEQTVGARHASPLPRKRHHLGDIVGSFKSAVTRRVNLTHHTSGERIWQRGYFEHIIRNERSLRKIQEYILTNPGRWQYDKENSARSANDGFDSCLNSQGKPSRRSQRFIT